jgi:hypothetical protein
MPEFPRDDADTPANRAKLLAYLRVRARKTPMGSPAREYQRRVAVKMAKPPYKGSGSLLDALFEATSPTDEGTEAHAVAMAAECLVAEGVLGYIHLDGSKRRQ